MRALFIAYISSVLLPLVYTSKTKKSGDFKAQTGEAGEKVRKTELKQITRHLTEQLEVLSQGFNLDEKSVECLREPQKGEILKAKDNETQPESLGKKSDAPPNKDDEPLNNEDGNGNDYNAIPQLMAELKLFSISTNRDIELENSTEQPEVPEQSLNLSDESVKSRRELQKGEIIEANNNETQPEILDTRNYAPSNKEDELPIYNRSRESIGMLDYEKVKKLTKDLTAKEWNTFLGKWYNTETGELELKSLFYLVPLDDERKVELMEEADKKNLEMLFVALVPREYAPKSPKVIELLEKRLQDFPEMQSHALLTLYTLDFPVSKWHFTSSKKDLEILLQVIEEGKLKREQVIGHLLEIVETDSVPETASGSLLALLMKTKLVYYDDFCDSILCQKACNLGSLRYLEKAKEFCPTLLPDQKCIDEAVKQGHELILEYIEKKLLQKVLPNQQAVDAAAANGKLEMLQKRCQIWMCFPSIKGAELAAEGNHLYTLKWMAGLNPPILPTSLGANWAAENGHLRILVWISTLNPPIRPTYFGANLATENDHLHILEWMAKQDPPILPTEDGANRAAAHGKLASLKWMAERDPPILPTANGANWAAMNGHFLILEWMASLKQPILPTADGADLAAKKSHLHVLRFLASLNPSILPTANAANRAAENGKHDILEWMASLNPPILPTADGADLAAENGHLHILKWMASLNPPILPTTDGANWAAENSHLHTLLWMASLNPPILPNEDGINDAARNGHLPILKWMASLNPSILPTYFGADLAAENGHLPILKWMANLNPLILPTSLGADWAAENGHLHILLWMSNLNPPTLSTYFGANWASGNGHLHIIKWMASLNPPVLPTENGADLAAKNDKLDILKLLASFNPPILPTENGAIWAAMNGYLHILEWMANLVPPIYPN